MFLGICLILASQGVGTSQKIRLAHIAFGPRLAEKESAPPRFSLFLSDARYPYQSVMLAAATRHVAWATRRAMIFS